MECACIDIDHGDICSLVTASEPIARKSHICCECGREIVKGETYTFETISCANDIETYKTCIDCKSIRDLFFCNFIYSTVREEFREYINDCGGDISESKIEELTPAARQWVCGLIEDYWDSSWEDE